LEALFGLGVLVLALGGVAIVVVRLLRRFRSRSRADSDPDPLAPLPNIEDLSVSGDLIRVTFGIPMVGDDPILSDLLTYYALEAVRRERRRLSLQGLEGLEVLISHRGQVRTICSVAFDEPGRLPDNIPVPEIVQLSAAVDDPLDHDFKAPAGKAPVAHSEAEGLAPLSSVLKIPAKAETALRLQGVDPVTMTAGELVRGVLALRGYSVSPGADSHTYHARKGSATVFLREVPHTRGGYPELSDEDMNRFVMDMVKSRMARGMLVTEKYGPFSLYKLERRDPRMRFVTRERLQKAIDALALG
jgi:hypothetical protein